MQTTYRVSEPLIELPPSLLREIGRTMVLSAHLEFSLSRIAYGLIGVDRQTGRIAVREPRLVERFDMITDLLTLKEFKSKTDLISLRRRLQKCDDQRNLVAHGIWTREPTTKTLQIIKTSGKWQPTPKHKAGTKRATHPEGVTFEHEESCRLKQ